MPVYEYIGYTQSGAHATGVVDADSPQTARSRLRSEGILITSIEATTSARGEFFKNPLSLLTERIGVAQIATFTRQLATLQDGGLTLTESLDAMIEQTTNARFKKVITDIRARVLQGESLAGALAAHGEHFNPLYVNLVRAGETSGALGETLERLATFNEERQQQGAKIAGAMIYPAVMLTIGSSALLFLMTYVMPKVLMMFEDMEAALPLPTVIVIALTDFLTGWWYAIIIALVGAGYGLNRYYHTPEGKSLFDYWILRLPLFGGLIRAAAIARFARSLGTLLAGGAPLIESLTVTASVVDHTQLSAAIDAAVINITEGEPIALPLKRSGLFPPLVTQMIAAGERSGSLPTMLEKIAKAYEFEVENALSTLMKLLEPLMILAMGAVVLFIVLAILLPIFEMSHIQM
jgi:general secretion pathway protein F